jgi:rfaE bifunctional protein nucleotidyltransferase chain/domain
MIYENLRKKILNRQHLSDIVTTWKENNEVIVFTNGCFDIMHPGHVIYLAKAADFGTKLIVAVNTDNSVRKLKGTNRPVLDENARVLILAAFSFVDAVVLFDEETPLMLIEQLLPHVLVKGKDYKAEDIVGHDAVIQNGGSVETIELVPGYSTSGIEEKIKRTR